MIQMTETEYCNFADGILTMLIRFIVTSEFDVDL